MRAMTLWAADPPRFSHLLVEHMRGLFQTRGILHYTLGANFTKRLSDFYNVETKRLNYYLHFYLKK